MKKWHLLWGSFFIIMPLFAGGPYTLFPIENYDQNIDHWISPSEPNYDHPLLDAQQQKWRMQQLYQHQFSPWQASYIEAYLQPGVLTSIESGTVKANAHSYNENMRPYPQSWSSRMLTQINLSQFQGPLYNDPHHRMIAVTNLMARTLPTFEPHFSNPDHVGQGYPFDNVQISEIWAGTPLYLVGVSKDQAFGLVITPSFIGWVDRKGLAFASPQFIQSWQHATQKKLLAITQNNSPILNLKQQFLLQGYIGSSFPCVQKKAQQWIILVPTASTHQQAQISLAQVSAQHAAVMPLSATPRHFAQMITALQGIPYGWGNLYFYDDCSSLLKNLYLPFGIWLPRHSSNQTAMGETTDLTPLSPEERLAYLQKNAAPFLSLVSLGSHVFMVIGNLENPQHPGQQVLLTFQTLWGLSPPDNSSRAIIGESVLLPLLLSYPENPNLRSLLNAPIFQLSNLQ